MGPEPELAGQWYTPALRWSCKRMERVLTDCCRAAGLTSWLTHLQRAAELHGTHVPDVHGAAIARRERGAADGLRSARGE